MLRALAMRLTARAPLLIFLPLFTLLHIYRGGQARSWIQLSAFVVLLILLVPLASWEKRWIG